MIPTEFSDQNFTIAANQPEYITLPVHVTQDGMIVSCWKATSWAERLRFLFTGQMFVAILTFGGKLQPQKLSVLNPLEVARQLLAERRKKCGHVGQAGPICTKCGGEVTQ